MAAFRKLGGHFLFKEYPTNTIYKLVLKINCCGKMKIQSFYHLLQQIKYSGPAPVKLSTDIFMMIAVYLL